MEISLKLSLQLFFPLILSYNLFAETLPLSQRYFHHTDMGYDYNRGTYLIVLADESLEPILLDDEENTGDFIHFKKTQGYDVEIITLASAGGTANNLHAYLQYYYENIEYRKF